jgi:hypothetical protein
MSRGTKRPETIHPFVLFSINSTYIGFFNSRYIDYSPSTVHLNNVVVRMLTVLISVYFFYMVFSIQGMVFSVSIVHLDNVIIRM